MKLRNKKTGDIWEFDSISMKILDTTMEKLKARGWSGSCFANSIAELNEEWEDVEDINVPIIKDEKIRKAVRAWADVNDAGKLKYNDDENSLDDIYRNTITFNRGLGLEDGKEYTIPELCGEDEE